jgi:hypothetical protein
MARPRDCDGCHEAHACKEAYGGPGNDEGPSVTCAALVAFVLPLVVFVAALGGLDHLLPGRVVEPYRTPLALVLALATTAALMLAGRFWVRRRRGR